MELLYSESLEKIWQKRDTFSGDEKMFNAWSFILIRNTFFTKYRKNKRDGAYHVDIDDVSENKIPGNSYDFLKEIEDKELLACFKYTIKKNFTQEYLHLFMVRFEHGIKYEEIADLLKIPVGTVKNRLHQLRIFLSDKKNILHPPIFQKNK